MGTAPDFDRVFCLLREVMAAHGAGLDFVKDEPSDYYLYTRHIMKNGKPLFFGAVQIRKNYVSYHLMPVYVFPDLLQGLPPGLQRRMQGKSCFNFRTVDDGLFKELARLTRAGLEAYREASYL